MSNESRRISREELYRLVWSKPTRDIAREFAISDVGLGRTCKRLNVPKPPPGYGQCIASGYKVNPPPLPRLGKVQKKPGRFEGRHPLPGESSPTPSYAAREIQRRTVRTTHKDLCFTLGPALGNPQSTFPFFFFLSKIVHFLIEIDRAKENSRQNKSLFNVTYRSKLQSFITWVERRLSLGKIFIC
jgi:hypothetical protein